MDKTGRGGGRNIQDELLDRQSVNNNCVFCCFELMILTSTHCAVLFASSLPQKSEMVATRTNISKFWGVGPNFKQPWFTTCIAMNSFSLQRGVTKKVSA